MVNFILNPITIPSAFILEFSYVLKIDLFYLLQWYPQFLVEFPPGSVNHTTYGVPVLSWNVKRVAAAGIGPDRREGDLVIRTLLYQ